MVAHRRVGDRRSGGGGVPDAVVGVDHHRHDRHTRPLLQGRPRGRVVGHDDGPVGRRQRQPLRRKDVGAGQALGELGPWRWVPGRLEQHPQRRRPRSAAGCETQDEGEGRVQRFHPLSIARRGVDPGAARGPDFLLPGRRFHGNVPRLIPVSFSLYQR